MIAKKITLNTLANAGSVELFLLPYVRPCFNVVHSPASRVSAQYNSVIRNRTGQNINKSYHNREFRLQFPEKNFKYKVQLHNILMHASEYYLHIERAPSLDVTSSTYKME